MTKYYHSEMVSVGWNPMKCHDDLGIYIHLDHPFTLNISLFTANFQYIYIYILTIFRVMFTCMALRSTKDMHECFQQYKNTKTFAPSKCLQRNKNQCREIGTRINFLAMNMKLYLHAELDKYLAHPCGQYSTTEMNDLPFPISMCM